MKKNINQHNQKLKDHSYYRQQLPILYEKYLQIHELKKVHTVTGIE